LQFLQALRACLLIVFNGIILHCQVNSPFGICFGLLKCGQVRHLTLKKKALLVISTKSLAYLGFHGF